MNNIVSAGRRLVLRVVLLQVGCAAVVGLLIWVLKGFAAGLSGLTGGMIVAIGSAIFGGRMFAPGIAPAGRLYRAMIAGESLKWLWYLFAIWAALTRFELVPLPLIGGLIVAQLAYFGLVGMHEVS